MIEIKLNVDPDEKMTLDSMQEFIDAAKALGAPGDQELQVVHHVAGRDYGGDKKGSDWCTVVFQRRAV